MPEIVLRNPSLPSQPIVIDVQEGGKVPLAYKTSGWEIDTSTDPEAAIEEHPAPVEPAPFVPEFEEDPDAPADITPAKALRRPAEPAAAPTEPTPDQLDTPKEN